MGKIIKPLGSIDRELSKNEIIELAENHTVQIIEGEYDLLKVYIELKRYQAYLDTIINELKEEAINKAKEQGQKSFEYYNARIQLQKRVKYNYGSDPRWNTLNSNLEQIKQEKKEREKLLKHVIGDQMEIVDEETGEIEKLIAPIKEMVDQIIVKL